MNSQHKPMVFFVRHGERADCVFHDESKTIEITVDPHLTELGKLQAKYAAHELQIMVAKEIKTPVKYLVVSSPFLRCLQTASCMAEALGKDNIVGQKIFFDNFLAEFQNKMYFASSPMESLYIRTKAEHIKKYFSMEIKEGLGEDIQHTIELNYPENTSSLFDRTCLGYRKTLEIYEKMLEKEKNIVLVLVTHGYGIQSLLDYYDAFDWDKGVEYTCLSQVFYDSTDKKGKIGVVQWHEQLEKAETEYKKIRPAKVDKGDDEDNS